MKLLAIETSIRPGSIALLHDGQLIEQATLEQPGRRHAQSLHVSAHELLTRHALRLTEIDAIAVSVGPGSFTGLRVGIVFAKTLAYVTGCQVAAVDSHLAVAQTVDESVRELTVVSDAQRRELFVSKYTRNEANALHQRGSIEIISQTDWLEGLSHETVAGPCIEKLSDLLPPTVNVADVASHMPQASSVGLIGLAKLRNGKSTDAWQLAPFYMRRSAAEENWDRRQAGLAPV